MSNSSALDLIQTRVGDRPICVAIVAPIVARYDAISAAARDTFHALNAAPGLDVTVLTYRNDDPSVRARSVSCVSALMLDPAFLGADVIIYEYGVYCPLFDAMIVGNGKARQVVHFHNITPPEFMAAEARPSIERAFRQLHNLKYVDEIWADSQVNADALEVRGIDAARIRVIPLGVEFPTIHGLQGKRVLPVEVLFVGRIVASKGVLDLVQAVAQVRQVCKAPFHVRIAGNLEFSNPAYLGAVKNAIDTLGLHQVVEFVGTVEDGDLQRLYHNAHVFAIPSYHEGFCKTVIEALRAGCVPIGYAAYNLPHVICGLGRVVPPGNIARLASSLTDVIEAIANCKVLPDAALPLDIGQLQMDQFDARAKAYVEQFSLARVASIINSRIATMHEDTRRAISASA
jgi:glycosyltransferase involved in cell wall biosynthesis